MSKVNVAIVGCGNISGIYLENLTDIVKNVNFDNVNVYAVADLIPADGQTICGVKCYKF